MQASLKLWCNLAFAAIISVLLAGCSDAGSSTQNENAQDESFEDGPIRLGLIPAEGGTDMVERFKPVITQLEKELGRPVEAFSATEYLGIITAMKNRQVDIVYFGPKSYVEANRIAGAVAVAKELNLDGLAGYFGIHDSELDIRVPGPRNRDH